MDEETRRIIHRILAVGLVVASFYHVFYLIATRRGRTLLRAIFPKMRDATEAMANVAYYMGLRKQPVKFHMYDYTQKAEYWALIWGTAVMAITGAVLWFPEATTSFTPAWVVRVAATIHFYEAILAVGAIIIWHFFFTIFHPKQYPQSWIWITGRMTVEEWEHHHGREPEETGEMPEVLPPANGLSDEELREHSEHLHAFEEDDSSGEQGEGSDDSDAGTDGDDSDKKA
jgi:cytochrome b subunit of formate dehydrogenase